MILVLIILPLIAAVLAFLFSGNRARMSLLVATAFLHILGVLSFWKKAPAPQWEGFLALDVLGLLVLTMISILFAVVSVYLCGYLRKEDDRSSRRLIACLLAFLSAMTAVTLSQHFALLWIAIELTTLFGATLINIPNSPQGVEATWKYLLLCSVGIALALLGTLFLAVSAASVKTLLLSDIIAHAGLLNVPWFKLSIIFFVVGYGTKMGLVPMHSWKPDTYEEAPGPMGALLSGALTSCAFLAILRVAQVCYHAGQMEFFQSIVLLLGILSVFVSGVFILSQTNFNRLLGYSSIEHMGILALGIGLGGCGIYGGLYHMINNAFSKVLIFLVAGNLYRQYRTKKVAEIAGVLHAYPWTGSLLLIGFFAVTGFPPFGTFFSELMIFNAAVAGGHYVVAGLLAMMFAVIFVGMAGIILKMAMGPVPSRIKPGRESLVMVVPIVTAGLIVFFLGAWMPSFLDGALRHASALLGGG